MSRGYSAGAPPAYRPACALICSFDGNRSRCSPSAPNGRLNPYRRSSLDTNRGAMETGGMTRAARVLGGENRVAGCRFAHLHVRVCSNVMTPRRADVKTALSLVVRRQSLADPRWRRSQLERPLAANRVGGLTPRFQAALAARHAPLRERRSARAGSGPATSAARFP
jgi:hypothetical protein